MSASLQSPETHEWLQLLFALAVYEGFAEPHAPHSSRVSGHRKLTMPVLETERLVLRKFDQDDLPDILRWEEISNARNPKIDAQKFLDYSLGNTVRGAPAHGECN